MEEKKTKKMTKAEAFEYLKHKKVMVTCDAYLLQDKLFEIGYRWCDGSIDKLPMVDFLFIDDYTFQFTESLSHFKKYANEEISADDILSIEIVEDGLDLPTKAPINHETSVGIDVGIKDFAVLSNGQVFENPKYLEKAEKRLKVLQRRLAKKQKGSKRREKARLAVAKAHEKVKNCRIDYIHKVTSKIIRENQTVIIEDLNVDGMMKNHNLAKHIASVSWSEFFRQLQYKAEWNGVNLIRIGRFEPSSKMCLCGAINKDLKLSQREWDCPNCGRHNDRDLLAAINIKRFGLQEQNLIGISPVDNRIEGVEWSALADTVKRQCVTV